MTQLIRPGVEPGPPGPSPVRLSVLWALSVAAVVVHNYEEWRLGMTGWMSDRPRLLGSSFHGDQDRYALALVIVTVGVLVVAVVAVTSGAAWSAGALAGVGYVLVINAGSHVLLSALAGSVMPGVITGVIVLLPLGLVVVSTLPGVRWSPAGVVGTALVAVVFVGGSLALAAGLTALS